MSDSPTAAPMPTSVPIEVLIDQVATACQNEVGRQTAAARSQAVQSEKDIVHLAGAAEGISFFVRSLKENMAAPVTGGTALAGDTPDATTQPQATAPEASQAAASRSPTGDSPADPQGGSSTASSALPGAADGSGSPSPAG